MCAVGKYFVYQILLLLIIANRIRRIHEDHTYHVHKKRALKNLIIFMLQV